MVMLQMTGQITQAQKGGGDGKQEVVHRPSGPIVPRETAKFDRTLFLNTLAVVN